MPRITNNHQKLGQRHEWFVSQPPEETSSDNTLILDFGFLNCEKINLCCFKSPGLWYCVTAVLENQYPLPPIVLGTQPPRVRLYLPVSLAASHLSALLLGSGHWDVNSSKVHSFLVVPFNESEGCFPLALSFLFWLECGQDGGVPGPTLDHSVGSTC